MFWRSHFCVREVIDPLIVRNKDGGAEARVGRRARQCGRVGRQSVSVLCGQPPRETPWVSGRDAERSGGGPESRRTEGGSGAGRGRWGYQTLHCAGTGLPVVHVGQYGKLRLYFRARASEIHFCGGAIRHVVGGGRVYSPPGRHHPTRGACLCSPSALHRAPQQRAGPRGAGVRISRACPWARWPHEEMGFV